MEQGAELGSRRQRDAAARTSRRGKPAPCSRTPYHQQHRRPSARHKRAAQLQRETAVHLQVTAPRLVGRILTDAPSPGPMSSVVSSPSTSSAIASTCGQATAACGAAAGEWWSASCAAARWSRGHHVGAADAWFGGRQAAAALCAAAPPGSSCKRHLLSQPRRTCGCSSASRAAISGSSATGAVEFLPPSRIRLPLAARTSEPSKVTLRAPT